MHLPVAGTVGYSCAHRRSRLDASYSVWVLADTHDSASAISSETSRDGIAVSSHRIFAPFAARAEGRALHGQLREAREVLHTLLTADAPDEAVVMQQADVIGGLETALMKHRLRSMLQIRALLTPEQRAELESIREEGPFRRFDAVREACAGEKETECPADDRGLDPTGPPAALRARARPARASATMAAPSPAHMATAWKQREKK